jgi:hypothetical protein
MLITPYDQLCEAGEPVTLEVEVEFAPLPFIDPPRRGIEVEVENFGRATTGADGRAVFPPQALPAGTHRLKVQVRQLAREVLLRVVTKDTPIFITDIDQTIADVTPFGFIVRPVEDVQALPGAVEAIREIAQSMQVVYLTARDHVFIRKTKDWLQSAGFPEGPLYTRRGTRFWSASPEQHKLARVGELRPRFPNVRWGVGDKPGDVVAYETHGIPAILLAPTKPAGVSEKSICLPDWKSILERVRKG